MKWGMKSSERGVQKRKLRVRSSEWGVQCSEFGVRSFEFWYLKVVMLVVASVLLVAFSLQTLAFPSEKWAGIDESVVKKVAKEHGREVKEPLINTDQGDLLLFVFLLAGVVGGFAAGYYWRILMVEKAAKIAGSKEVIKG